MSFIQRKLNEQSGRDPASAAPQGSTSHEHAESPANAQSAYAPPAKHRTPPKLAQMRRLLRPKLLKSPDEADTWRRDDPEKINIITDRYTQVVESLAGQRAEFRLSPNEFAELRELLLDDILGFGAIDPLVRNRECSEIMVNGGEVIFGEFKGRLIETDLVWDDEEHVMWTAQRIVRPLSRELNRMNPMVDARLPDGSRVHIVTLPSALAGTTMTIRKFPERRLTIDDFIKFGTITPEVAEFLNACVGARLNVLVSGGTGSGKTTTLNVLSRFIPNGERIVTIEDSAELQLSQNHVVRLETAPPMPGTDHKGQLTIRDLVRGALRMRPDRIIVGECRSGEALDMLQAMNTGHDGSMTTVHANNPRDTLARLETLVMMSGMDLPLYTIRRQIVSAVDVIVQQSRLKDGSRKITQITELQGMEGESIVFQDLFVYKMPGQTGNTPAAQGGGKLESTGFRPNFMDRLEENGFRLSSRVFGAGAPRPS